MSRVPELFKVQVLQTQWGRIVTQPVCQIIVQQTDRNKVCKDSWSSGHISLKSHKSCRLFLVFPRALSWDPFYFSSNYFLLDISSLNLPSILIAMQMTPCSTCPSPKPPIYPHLPAHYLLSQPTGNQNPLHYSRDVTRQCERSCCPSAVLRWLYWLPVKYFIDYKILPLRPSTLLLSTLHSSISTQTCTLLFSTHFTMPPPYLTTAGSRAFRCSASCLWNSTTLSLSSSLNLI